MNIAIVAPVWGRYLRTELFWRAAQRLQRQWEPHQVSVFVSGDELQHRQLARRYGGEFIEQDNELLGKKFNVAVEAAFHDGADYTVIMGSDDIMSPVLGAQYKVLLDEQPFYAGLSGLLFLDPVGRRALGARGSGRPDERKGEPIGPGRVLSRTLVHGMWYNTNRPLEIWPSHIKSAADWWMTMNMRRFGVVGCERMIEGDLEEQFLADVKSVTNVWSFEKITDLLPQATKVTYDEVVSKLPESEREIIAELEEATCPACGHVQEL